MASATKRRLLIGASGSVATIKLEELVQLAQQHFEVQVVLTSAALHFTSSAALSALLGVPVHTDTGEWAQWQQKGDPVLHIDLMNWADGFLIAPLSANTLAKLATGLADNLLTCVVRAWPVQHAVKPVVVAPAMNTRMWDHPFTARQLRVLREELGFHIVEPIVKVLACGEYGTGAMEEPKNIVQQVLRILTEAEARGNAAAVPIAKAGADTA
eukprot:GGOE01049805.1.p2 GENE.GGOE01049805.1~~GGOE01049805.1.p2  ORF type:complete len:220 (-),score=78.96 GGOE01049805.1:389-1027(-)